MFDIGVTAVVTDAAEQSFFAGCADGSIYQVELFRCVSTSVLLLLVQCCVCSDKTLTSKFQFSFSAPVHLLWKKRGEFVKISLQQANLLCVIMHLILVTTGL